MLYSDIVNNQRGRENPTCIKRNKRWKLTRELYQASAAFSGETLRAREEWDNVLKVSKEKT